MERVPNNIRVLFIVIAVFTLFPLGFADEIKSGFNSRILDNRETVSDFSFFVAGHIYGAYQNEESVFPSPSILGAVDFINKSEAKFFVSLGDIIRKPYPEHIKNFKASLVSRLNIPFFNAVGSHELGVDRKLYERNFGRETYFDFIYGNSIFIFLDAEIYPGEIKAEQLSYLQNILKASNSNSDIKNIFIFSHKLIWVVNNLDYAILSKHINDSSYRNVSNNFQKEIEPYLKESDRAGKSVYWFSGDIGASHSYALFCEKDKEYEITYIATGLGDNINDMMIDVSVFKDGGVELVPVSLTGQKLQSIFSYNTDYWADYFNQERFKAESFPQKIKRIVGHKFFLSGFFGGVIFGVSFFLLVLKIINAKR